MITVRQLEPADLGACAAIEAACYPPEVREGEEVLRGHHKHWPPGCLAALVEGTVVGYISGIDSSSESGPRGSAIVGSGPS